MDINEIKHLAELSKLQFSEEEIVEFTKDFESIVNLADIIRNADVQGERKLQIINMNDLREDKAEESCPVDVLLQNSPIVTNDSIVVPQIME